ncbi:hypothetical protein CN878_22275 [Ochrobactrum sp. 695/2009]|nr:hypothetical protein CN881_07645 [Ochrobactrum sp. 721/2009]PJT15755.1 hypothetical protein CN880_12320 [Ochrobactrum sp. 720/2009]PJT23883.1 hypothetical protein CN879_08610 [Ochrobactrum sp. 715/2009]PJT24027.1 hypothetical protein CN878_22275 [Ochrobactrum sp. 695/2009]PJT33558.1 hypothetical protein CN877_13950 [Ochrobactrum sp. 689/2009]
MYPHVGEVFIPVRNASCAADQIYTKIAKLCRSARLEGPRKSVVFEEGGAIIQSTNNGLFLHIFAHDALTFYGIRALIEGNLPEILLRSVDCVEWIPRKAEGTIKSR